MTSYEIPIYKTMLVRDCVISSPEKSAVTPEAAAMIARNYLAGVDREHLIVILLGTKLQIIGINTVSMGSIEETVGSPREIFKAAILAGAHGIIVAHNHPSGDPTPSPWDLKFHMRIEECGRLLQIEMIDAIIIGTPDGNEFYSEARAKETRENPYKGAKDALRPMQAATHRV